MKLFIFISLLVFAMNANAQITLEQTYDSASTIGSNSNGFITSQLMYINFETSGERYVKINRAGASITIYDLNHSLLKTISLVNIIGSNPNSTNILYLSEHLFNSDDKIEFMILLANDPLYFTGIYNEDGTLIFSDNGAAMIRLNVPLQQYPIYNTSLGTKMILSYIDGQAKVFSLPGILSQSIIEANNVLLEQSSMSEAYPNPAFNYTKVDYTLEPWESKGEIVFYNMQGNEVKRFRVDNSFNTLYISTSDIAAGTYFFQLQTSAHNSKGKKMVVVK